LNDLKNNRDEARIAAGVIERLRTPAPVKHNFPNWMGRVETRFRKGRLELNEHADFPDSWIDQAEAAVKVCRESGEDDVLLHGDLHHHNILLDHKRGWIAIDPKGVIGHPGLEVGRYSFNWLPGPIENAGPFMNERMTILSEELGDSRVRERALVDVIQCLCQTIGKERNSWKNTLFHAGRFLTE
jgi:streptomycin 6-kinase